jgi:hypothetical protein
MSETEIEDNPELGPPVQESADMKKVRAAAEMQLKDDSVNSMQNPDFVNIREIDKAFPDLRNSDGPTRIERGEGEDSRSYYDKITTYSYKGKNIPVPIRWHPYPVIRRIVNHNKIGQYTGIVMIGMSGSGKTTLTRKILHTIHTMGENYKVLWFSGKDMLNIDKIIASCTVGVPHILIFDDASYVMEDAKKDEMARLANALTTVRHQIKSRVITITNIHYSKATKKFFRNQHFTFLTSITTEEMGNYQDLFKEKMSVIRKFARMYFKMMTDNSFRIPISSYLRDNLYYTTNEPFRLGIVAEITDVHFMLYNRESCNMCDPETAHNVLRDYHPELIKLKNTYGVSALRRVARFFATIYGGENHLTTADHALWKHLSEIQRNVKVPWKEFLAELDGEKKPKPGKRPHKGAKQARIQSGLDVMAQFQKEQAEKNAAEQPDDFISPPSGEQKPNPSDYDSLYKVPDDGSGSGKFR